MKVPTVSDHQTIGLVAGTVVSAASLALLILLLLEGTVTISGAESGYGLILIGLSSLGLVGSSVEYYFARQRRGGDDDD